MTYLILSNKSEKYFFKKTQVWFGFIIYWLINKSNKYLLQIRKWVVIYLLLIDLNSFFQLRRRPAFRPSMHVTSDYIELIYYLHLFQILTFMYWYIFHTKQRFCEVLCFIN